MKFYTLLLCICVFIASCRTLSDNNQKQARAKIHFNLNEIDENGLIGPETGKHSVAYEFCIPLENTKRKEVAKIDSSVQFYANSRGRVGCGESFYLCIGEGATKEVLLKLARLDYILSIEPFYGE